MVSPIGAAADSLRDILAQRIMARQQAAAYAQKMQQQDFENSIKQGNLDLERQKANAPKSKTPLLIRNVSDGKGGSMTQILDPETRAVLREVPEYHAPQEDGAPTVIRDVAGPGGKPQIVLRNRKGEQIGAFDQFVKPDAAPRPSYSFMTMEGPDGHPALFRGSANTGQIAPVALPEGVRPKGAAEKPPTGAQEQVFDYYRRMKGALNDMSSVEDQLSPQDMHVIRDSPTFEAVNQKLLSPAGRQYLQALRSFTTAKLRKESGAAISQGEYQNEALIVARAPDDNPDLMTQKRRTRQTVLEGFALQSGPKYRQFYGHDFTPGAEDDAQSTAPIPGAAGGGMPQVGHIVTVRGQRVKVTGVSPDGKMTGIPVDANGNPIRK